MIRRIIPATLALLLFAATAFAQTDRRIEAVNRLRAKVDEDITKSEAEPEYSNIYLTELAVNKNNGSYPAVGVYRPVARFYYTYGDREKEPYPNRLLKIVVTVARSDAHEYSEFVFNESGQMVFYLDKKDDMERQVYFAAGRAIRFEQDGRVLSLGTQSRTAIIAGILKENVRLVAIFRRSLEF
ncbi:MAG TPA: hypothetical protein VJS17_05220 [Pyrinomonadaceae bacterium]|nr:hypothetical protein [Pyrinomonadaceae bacterium]